jgi:cell division protein FtsQ
MNKKALLDRLKQLGWMGFLLIVVLSVTSAVQRKKGSSCEDISVKIKKTIDTDTTFITEKDIIDLLSTSFEEEILGNSLERIDIGRMERILERNPFVKEVDVFMDNKNVIHIEIIQRKPMMRIMDSDGRNYYLDADGNYMPLSIHYTARVPVATGFIPAHTPDFLARKQYGLKDIFELMTLLNNDPFYKVMIEQVHVSQNGDIILIPKIGGQQILFGIYHQAQKKLERLKIFYDQALPHEGWDKYRLIDIRFSNQIVCRR